MSRRDANAGRRHEWPWILLRLVVTAVVLVAGYLGVAYYLGTHVPSRTTAAGVDIGGLSRSGAEQALQRALAARVDVPVRIALGSTSVSIDPSSSGLRVDYDATLRGRTGVDLHPEVVWQRLTGSSAVPLRVRVDKARLTRAVSAATRGVATTARTGSVRFDSGRVVSTASVTGHRANIDATVAAIAAGWPVRSNFRAALFNQPPAITSAQIHSMATGFGEEAMAGPVRIVVGRTTVSVSTDQLSSVLSVQAIGSRLVPRADGARLAALVAAQAPRLGRAPVDAVVRVIGGKPVIIPARAGRGVLPGSLATGVLRAVGTPSRTLRLALHSIAPARTTATVRAFGITDRLAQYAQPLPAGAGNAATRHNALVAAQRLDGQLVLPGRVTSLVRTLGHPTKGAGYQAAPVFDNGRLTNGVGGGISWTATALYNAAYLAGVQIVAHTPHTALLAGYPAGRDATIAYPDTDLRWKNDTGRPILVQATVRPGTVQVAFWGTTYAEVTADATPRTALVPARTFSDSAPGCVPQHAVDGFTITVTRVLRLVDGPTRYQPFLTRYLPLAGVRCTVGRATPR